MCVISCVITSHNGRLDVLKRAIDSVFAQSYTDWELILIDDASKDGTEEYGRKLAEDNDNVKYHRIKKCTQNHAIGKNIGTKMAEGEYIAYLDSDNVFTKDHFQALINGFEDGIDLVYGVRKVIDEETGKIAGMGISMEFSPRVLLERNYIDTSDFLCKKQAILDVGGWDERSTRMLDWNLMVRMVKMGKVFKRVNLVVTDYYIGGEDKLSSTEEKYPWTPVDIEIELPYLKELEEPKVAVFSLTYDRLEMTKKCFASLKETAEYSYDHFVYDNGSRDGTVKYLEKGDFKHVTYSGDNKGISIASNEIIKTIKSFDYDIIVKVDNDCLFQSSGWLKEMVEIWKRNRLVSLSTYISGLRGTPGGAERYAYGFINKQLIGLTRHLGGICHFVGASAYDDFKWDETQPMHGVQDLEFSKYLLNNGYDMGYLENYQAEHCYGTEEQIKKFKKYFERRKQEKIDSYEKTNKGK